MARSCMKTRTSSYKLLRKRHNYGRRGSEPSALAHIGRALNDELDTVYARAPLREVCPQERRERKKERIRVYIYIYTCRVCSYVYDALPQPPTHFPRDFFSRSTRRTTLSPDRTPLLPSPSSSLPPCPAYLSSRREGDETFKRKRHACFLDPAG